MDILHLVDRLEELIFSESRSITFLHSVIVNEDRIVDIIDQMRVSIPEEIKKAQQILAQRDRILAQAQEEAARTLNLARENRDQMVERDSIVDTARVRAEEIIDQARQDVERTKHDADDYVLQTLTDLESEMDRILMQVRNGIRAIQTEKQAVSNTENRSREG